LSVSAISKCDFEHVISAEIDEA